MNRKTAIIFFILLVFVIFFRWTRMSNPVTENYLLKVSDSNNPLSKDAAEIAACIKEGTLNLYCADRKVAALVGFKNGVNRATAAIPELFSDNKIDFATCHMLLRRVGDHVYTLYRDGLPVELDDNSDLCEYGLYHGFLDAMKDRTGEIHNDEIRSFCNAVQKNYVPSVVWPQSDCYHGMGHAFADVANIRWDDLRYMEEQIFVPGIARCQKVFGYSVIARWDCVDGIFHATTFYAGNNLADGLIGPRSPFTVCDHLDKSVRRPCHIGLADLPKYVARNLGINTAMEVYRKTYKISPSLQPYCHHYLDQVGRNAFRVFQKGGSFDVSNDMTDCHAGFFHGALSSYLADHAKREDLLNFCRYMDFRLSQNQKKSCTYYIGFGSVVPISYSQDSTEERVIKTQADICNTFPSEIFRSACKQGALDGGKIHSL